MGEDERLNRDIRAYSRSQAIDRTEDYVRRGRVLAGAETADLKRQWIAIYRHWCHAVRNYRLQQEANDLESELALRHEEVPIEAVVEEMNILADALKAELTKLDPAQLRRMGERMLEELEAFRRSKEAQH